MKLDRHFWFWAVPVAAVVAAVICWEVWIEDYPVRQFGVVEKGVLYRSGQPTEEGWRRLWDGYKIHTVINLREEEPDQDWCKLERDFCAANGIRYVNMSIGPEHVDGDQLQALLQIIADPKCRPVLVHCELGKARTGVVVAAYRIAAQHWSADEAVRESRRYKPNMDPAYIAYLWSLSKSCQR
ncbi:MAG: tyrosine-protein phosphatase [Planctomycetaceae bacterium]|nr:tyrosine-protein phosphatase [Planctomycetaceae bacterium]